MLREINTKGFNWIDGVGLTKNQIVNILGKYNIHELDLEACLEGNQKARIDRYEDYSFLILHFPKYNTIKKIYELNEFNIFLGKDFLITFRDSTGSHINTIYNSYEKLNITGKEKDIKITTGYILYEITQAMFEKMFKIINDLNIEIKNLENKVFDGDNNSSLVKDIMFKKRNIFILNNMFKPQISVLKQLEVNINELYKNKMEVYFEDLEDKLDQIVNEMNIIQEYILNVEDAFKSMVDIKTNFVIKVLTVFSAFLLPLTLITSFYGMNLDLPFSDNIKFIYFLLFTSVFLMVIIYVILRKKGKF